MNRKYSATEIKAVENSHFFKSLRCPLKNKVTIISVLKCHYYTVVPTSSMYTHPLAFSDSYHLLTNEKAEPSGDTPDSKW